MFLKVDGYGNSVSSNLAMLTYGNDHFQVFSMLLSNLSRFIAVPALPSRA
jgi:hypothetical protein